MFEGPDSQIPHFGSVSGGGVSKQGSLSPSSISDSSTYQFRRSSSRYGRTRSRRLAGWILVLAIVAPGYITLLGQTGSSTASVTVGMPAPVVGKEFTVDALVTNPAFTPAPQGSVQFDFGDGTAPVTVPLSYRAATTTHTYAAAGPAKVTAAYSGDSNFAPASAVVQGQILRSVPHVTLNVYGDSISYATNDVYADGRNWVTITGWVQGWSLNAMALPGYKVADEMPFIYGTKVATDTYSAVLIGQNEFTANSAPYLTQYKNSLLASAAWLLTPDTLADGTHPKVTAQDQSVTKDGTWTQSTLYPTLGLKTTAGGDSLTTTVTGSTVYLGLSGTTANDDTVDVLVDGALLGEYSPSIVYPGSTTTAIPWGIRIPVPGSELTAAHTLTVVCKSPGTSGCNVDWFAGNGFVVPNKLPLLWLGEPYHTNQTGWTIEQMLPYIQAIRQIGQDLQADGLGVTLVDVFDSFNGQLETQCLADDVHAAKCGHQVIGATFLNAMNWLFTKDQRIDFGTQNQVNFSATPIPITASATSGLPVELKVVSGPATSAGGAITSTSVGTVVLEADQGGDADYRPAAPEQTTIQILPAPVIVAVQPTSTQVVAPGAFPVAVQVTWSGNTPISGSVTLYDGNYAIGTAQLDETSTATFASVRLSVGTHALTANYAQQGNFAAGVSAPANVTVVYLPADLQIAGSSGGATVAAGQQVSFSLNLVPSLGFTPTVTFACAGLPALASCQFSQNPQQVGANGGTETVTIVTTGPKSNLPAVIADGSNIGQPDRLPRSLAGMLLSQGTAMGFLACVWRRRRRSGRISRAGFIAMVVLPLILASLITGCAKGLPPPKTPAGTSTVTITAVAAQGTTSVTRTANFQLNVGN